MGVTDAIHIPKSSISRNIGCSYGKNRICFRITWTNIIVTSNQVSWTMSPSWNIPRCMYISCNIKFLSWTRRTNSNIRSIIEDKRIHKLGSIPLGDIVGSKTYWGDSSRITGTDKPWNWRESSTPCKNLIICTGNSSRLVGEIVTREGEIICNCSYIEASWDIESIGRIPSYTHIPCVCIENIVPPPRPCEVGIPTRKRNWSTIIEIVDIRCNTSAYCEICCSCVGTNKNLTSCVVEITFWSLYPEVSPARKCATYWYGIIGGSRTKTNECLSIRTDSTWIGGSTRDNVLKIYRKRPPVAYPEGVGGVAEKEREENKREVSPERKKRDIFIWWFIYYEKRIRNYLGFYEVDTESLGKMWEWDDKASRRCVVIIYFITWRDVYID